MKRATPRHQIKIFFSHSSVISRRSCCVKHGTPRKSRATSPDRDANEETGTRAGLFASNREKDGSFNTVYNLFRCLYKPKEGKLSGLMFLVFFFFFRGLTTSRGFRMRKREIGLRNVNFQPARRKLIRPGIPFLCLGEPSSIFSNEFCKHSARLISRRSSRQS